MKTDYKAGDFVTFYESFEIAGKYIEDMHDEEEIAFETVDVTKDMLIGLDKWYDNEIAAIDEDGDYKFEDFPWTWPVEVIKGLSDRKNNE